MTKSSVLKPVAMKQFYLTVAPKRGGGCTYQRGGLRCRMVRPGVYRIRREDGGKISRDTDIIIVEVQWRAVGRWLAHGCYSNERFCDFFEVVVRLVPRSGDLSKAKPHGGATFSVLYSSRLRG
jgi:hypothetical protein